MGEDDWEQTRQGDLGRTAPRRVLPDVTAPTEKIDPGHEAPPVDAEVTDVLRPPRTSSRPGPARRVAAVTGYTVIGLVSLLVLGLTGYAWAQYNTFDTAVHRSDALLSPTERKSLPGDTNILVMGLDSRLDENGKPLPRNIYNALHAGDDSVGGFNANVLMLLHVPAHGQAVEISIPRDDYVDLPGCPDGVCKEKIKQAYGLARDEAYRRLSAKGVQGAALEQQARDAGRKEEADTVSQFLGGVPIDHFVEVTLVAFFEIAQVVQPVTVCLLKPTRDTYSGAHFHAGRQQLNAVQALAFVRQRRDNVKGDFYYHDFTDLDRERRQQAFLSSLAYQLRQAGTFANPSKLSGILNVAKRNTAIDSGLDLLEFAQEASNLTGGHVTYNTLPVRRYADLGGSIGDVNIVDLPVVRAEVRQLLSGRPETPATDRSTAPGTPTSKPKAPVPPAATVDVVNRSGHSGIAGRVATALAGKGFTKGSASTESLEHDTVVEYGTSAARPAATAVAGLLGDATVQRSDRAGAHVRVVVGTGFSLPAALGGTRVTAKAAGLAAEAPGSNANAPSPLDGSSVPCVK